MAVMVAAFGAVAQLEGGFKAGLNINTVRYRDADPNSASIGYHAGAFMHIRLSESDLFLRPEVQYSLKGYRTPVTGANGQITSRLHYITLPVLLIAPIGTKFITMAGPEFGYLFKAVEKYKTVNNDITGRYQHFDWGLDIGAGYYITPQLGLEIRYNYGFRGLTKGIMVDQNGTPIGTNRDGANRVFQAGLFYSFTTGQRSSGGNPRF